jgi:prevent-host-death family protein
MNRKITQRELRNESAAVMDAVESGETITITRNGRAVAELRPIDEREKAPLDAIQDLFSALPSMSYERLRADIDEFFGDDDRIRDEDYE